MIIDETRYIWNNLMETLSPAFQLYSQLRPLILLPFNIWFFFASLPFRLFFAVTSSVNKKKPASLVLKENVMELKDTVIETVLPKSSTESHHANARTLEMMEERPHGWYAVEKKETKGGERMHKRRSSKSLKSSAPLDKSIEEPQQLEQSQEEKPRDEKPREETNWSEKLSEMESRIQSSSEERLRLESELEELNKKFTDDEKALASFEQEKRRFRNLINVEQKKCHDSQLEIITLKNQLKNEHESRLKAEQQLNASKKQEKKEERASKKDLKKSTKMDQQPVESKKEETPAPEHSVWGSDNHIGFTEMVEQESKHKKFSDVLKQSITPVVETTKSSESPSEFVVVGGDLSSKHVTAAPRVSPTN